MAQWLVKDLSLLTGVSKQTLHHYDRINLLKPSLRLTNGYRVYSEQDLLRLQQIIALKFFGFELNQIKTLLAADSDALTHFANQAKVLEQKAAVLLEGAKTLRSIHDSVDQTQSIPWQTIIPLIEVYRMTAHLEHDWVKEIFTAAELKEYAQFEKEMKAHIPPEKRAAFEKNWHELVNEIKLHLHENPNSVMGIELGKRVMDWVNRIYGKKYAHLRTKKFKKGFSEGRGLDEVGLTPELVTWMDQAVDAYWRDRVYAIFDQVEKIPERAAVAQWNALLEEIYGYQNTYPDLLDELGINAAELRPAVKAWLKKC